MAILDLFTDGVTDFDGKNAAEVIQGKLFVETRAATKQTSTGEVLPSRRRMTIWARGARPRRCVFWGTSNDYEYLSPTGKPVFCPLTR